MSSALYTSPHLRERRTASGDHARIDLQLVHLLLRLEVRELDDHGLYARNTWMMAVCGSVNCAGKAGKPG